MKKLKITLTVLFSLIALFYIFFLFVLPNISDNNLIKSYINNIAKENAGIELNIEKIKLLTGFPLQAGITTNNVTIICNNNQQISLKSVNTKINLFPLLLKKISLNNIDIEGLNVSSDISAKGELSIAKCFVFPQTNEEEQTQNTPNFVLDNKLPDINIKDVKLSLFDEETKNTLSVNINALNADKIILNKHFRVDTTGSIYLNNSENINFDIKADGFLPDLQQENNKDTQTTQYFNFIKEFARYNLKSNITADLKIKKNDNNKLVLNGFANIDNLSFKAGNVQLPYSYINIDFDKHNTKINSELYVSDTEKLTLTSNIKNAKKPNINLDLKTEKISFENIQKISTELLSTFNIPNDFNEQKIKGFLTADLKFKTDTKNVNSDGYLKIVNGELISTNTGLRIKDFNSYINCENNTVNINNTSLKVNDALILAKGTIDEKANTNIEISTKNLQIAKLAEAFLTGDLKKNYKINNGLLDLTVKAKGRLKEIKPAINLTLSSLNIYDKINKITLSNKQTIANILTDGKTFSGDVVINTTKAVLTNYKTTANIPLLKINLSKDNINIPNTNININSSILTFAGTVQNYLKTPEINFKINGNILANDIKKFIPQNYYSFVKVKGSLPVTIAINGKNNINIQAKVSANKNNYIEFINIDKLQNQNTITNINVDIKNNNIHIKDAGIYKVNNKNSNEIIKLSGEIINFNTLKNIKLDLSETLKLNIMNISAQINGIFTASGNINKPQTRGNISISNLNAPDYLIKNQTTNINITPSSITAQIFGLNLAGDVSDANLVIKNDFNIPYIITKATINSKTLDLDKLLLVTSKFASAGSCSSTNSNPANTAILPVKVQQGNWKVDKFKLATIEASNLNTNFSIYNDILDFKNLTSTAYKGSLNGDIKYNLKNLLMSAKLNGNNMDANPAAASLLGIKDQIMGTLKFNADISMKGADLTEQLSTMKGTANFEVKNGQLGSLGKFETYLKAANIMSMKILETSINLIISTILPYNSGQISSATGKLTFSNGYVYFSPVKTSGKEMALFVTGKLNMLNYTGDIKILGRINTDMTEAMGALANLSFEKILNNIPMFGKVTSALLEKFNTTAIPSDINNIPKLTPSSSSKTFKVILKGNLLSASGVKSFQWLTSEEKLNSTEKELQKKNSVATTREELIKEIKTGVENKKQQIIQETEQLKQQSIQQTQQKINETAKQITDKIDNNQAIKNLKTFGDYLQKKVEEQKSSEE